MKALLLLLSLFVFTFSQAQTTVGGIISLNTTWNASGNPYVVTADITINENVTLSIEPGVIIKFNKGVNRYNIYVFGTLRAMGTEDSIITFTSNEFLPHSGDWDAIIFYDECKDYDFNTQSGCILQYCNFEYSGSYFGFPGNTFISMQNSTAYIDHCIFSKNSPTVITAAGQNTELRITSNQFLSNSNSYALIFVMTDYALTDISYNLFYNNRSWMASMHGNCNFHNNLIIGNNKGSFDVDTSDQFYKNTFVDNYDILGVVYNRGNAEYNTFSRNVFENSIGSGAIIELNDSNATANYNNISGIIIQNWGSNFILSTNINRESYYFTPIDATNNWFNETSVVELGSLIDDYFDDTTNYSINFQPFLLSPDINAPITPPIGVNKTDLGGGNVKVAWNPNPDADVAGYKIYWGNPTGYSFTNSIDVGNVLSYTLTGFNFTDTVAVTAYDADADGSHDQCDGNESWFTYDYMFTGIPEIGSTQRNYLCYPNPADEFTALDISFPGKQNGKVVIASAMGESIRSIQLKSLQHPIILISDLACGIYTVSIYRGEERIGLSKLVIVH